MRTSPESSRSTPEISPCACRNALSICSAAPMNRSPAPVSFAPVVRRSNSFAPTVASSAAIRRLTVAWSSLSRLAAATNWPPRATARKTRTLSQSNEAVPLSTQHRAAEKGDNFLHHFGVHAADLFRVAAFDGRQLAGPDD